MRISPWCFSFGLFYQYSVLYKSFYLNSKLWNGRRVNSIVTRQILHSGPCYLINLYVLKNSPNFKNDQLFDKPIRLLTNNPGKKSHASLWNSSLSNLKKLKKTSFENDYFIHHRCCLPIFQHNHLNKIQGFAIGDTHKNCRLMRVTKIISTTRHCYIPKRKSLSQIATSLHQQIQRWFIGKKS